MSAKMRASYLLLLLSLVHALASVDRSIASFLANSMIRDLSLSDAEFGLIVGLVFVVAKLAATFPMARWVDRGNRKSILVVCTLIWSATTMASALVITPLQLLICRILLGAAESNTPVYFSIVSDLYPKRKRAHGVGVLFSGLALVTIICFTIFGPLNERYGWRWTTFWAGVFSFMVAILVGSTMKDPPRGAMDNLGAEAAPLTLRATAKVLVSQRTFLYLVIGFSIQWLGSGAIIFWYPTFLERVHHLGSVETGTAVGVVNGLCSFAGYLVGGFLIERLSKNDDRWQAYGSALGMLCYVPATLFATFTANAFVSIALFGLATFFMTSITGSVYALAMSVLPPRARGLGAATVLVTGALMDYGLSPFWSGALTDFLRPALGSDSMRVAFVPAAATALIAAAFFGLASRHVQSDITRVAPDAVSKEGVDEQYLGGAQREDAVAGG
jgi:MFS family permease